MIDSRCNTICGHRVQWVTHNDTHYILVQRMVDHVHVVGGFERTVDAINGARE